MSDTTPQRHILGTALKRFGVVAVLIAVVVAVLTTWLVGQVSTKTYSAVGQFVVPVARPLAPGQLPLPNAPSRPTNPGDAQAYAKSYTALLGQDAQILAHLSGPTGMSADSLDKAINAVNEPDTDIIQVTFTADRPDAVRAYFATMSTLLAAPADPSTNIPAGNLKVLHGPDRITVQPGLKPVAPYLGVVVGLLLGLSAAVLLERVNTQVRSAQDLRAMVTWPVLELPARAPRGRYETIVLRALTGREGVRRGAVVSAAGVSADTAIDVADHLAHAEADLRRTGRLPAATPSVVWEALGRLPNAVAERGLQDAGAAVLLVPHHARLRATAEALQRLEDLAVDDVVIVLGSSARALRRTGDTGPTHTDVGASSQERVDDSAVARTSS